MNKKSERKVYESVNLEREVAWMFNKRAKSSGKTKSDYLVALLELDRNK